MKRTVVALGALLVATPATTGGRVSIGLIAGGRHGRRAPRTRSSS